MTGTLGLKSSVDVARCLCQTDPYNQSASLIVRRQGLLTDLWCGPRLLSSPARTEGHILIAFLAYCLWVTLKNRLQALAPGLTPKAVLEKLATIQMLDVWLPTTDGRTLVMPRYTQPESDQALLLHNLKLSLLSQPLRASKPKRTSTPKKLSGCSADLLSPAIEKQRLNHTYQAL
jgi:hypothetical protein